MSDLRDVLGALATLQLGLSITAPLPMTVKGAHTYPPDRNVALPDTPCWVNSWSLQQLTRPVAGGLLRHTYEITAQLFVLDANLDRGCDIATAFHVQFVRALNGNITLDGTVRTSDLRGGSPTLALLEWGGKGYPGLHELVEVMFDESLNFN